MSRELNNKMLSVCGASTLHSLGFKGNLDIIVMDVLNDKDGHGTTVAKSLKISAPYAKIEMVDAGDITWKEIISREKLPDMIVCSLYSFSYELSIEAVKKGILVCCATGNSGRVADGSKWEHVLDFGAIYENMIPTNYSTPSEYVDLVTFVPYIEGSEGYWFQPIGTSFANPFGSGVIACLMEYWNSIGYKHTPSSIKEYVMNNAVDMLSEGRDSKTGNGYLKVGLMKKIELEIGGKAFVDGVEVPIDVPAQIIKGRTLVPARFLAENLGCKLQVTQEVGKPVSKVTIFQEI